MMFFCIESGKKLDENRLYRKVKNRCKICLNKKFKCDFCGKFFTKKWLKTHIEREHHENENNSNVIKKTIIDSANNNYRTLLFGVSFSGKTYLMLKILSRILKRDIYIITKSPQNSMPIPKSKLKK